MKSLREPMLSRESCRVYVHTLFRRCNKCPFWANTQWNPYTNSSGKPSKKTLKKAFQRAWISDSTEASSDSGKSCECAKLYSARPAAILKTQNCDCAPLRPQRVIYNSCFSKKRKKSVNSDFCAVRFEFAYPVPKTRDSWSSRSQRVIYN